MQRIRMKRPILRAQLAAQHRATNPLGNYPCTFGGQLGPDGKCYETICLPMPTPNDPDAEACVTTSVPSLSGPLGVAAAAPTQEMFIQFSNGSKQPLDRRSPQARQLAARAADRR